MDEEYLVTYFSKSSNAHLFMCTSAVSSGGRVLWTPMIDMATRVHKGKAYDICDYYGANFQMVTVTEAYMIALMES